MAYARNILASLVVAALLLSTSTSFAAKLKIGDKAPDWSGIIGTDGQKHALADHKKASLLVMVFTCNSCPVAKAYEERLVAFQKTYAKKGVQVVAVNVNVKPSEQLEKMKQRAKEKKYNFPYLADPTQKMGHDYGAKKTPEVFVLDKKRAVVYHGAIDDNMRPGKVKKHYLQETVDALLRGDSPPQTETKAVGCGIKYKK